MADLARSPRMAGSVVRKARLAQGLTQKALAARMNVRQATISKLESGEPATRMAVLFDALAALGLEVTVTPRSGKSNFENVF